MFTVSITKDEPEARHIGELSHLDFGKPAGVLGCFLNFEPQKLYEPSDRQKKALEEEGVIIPNGVTNIDASAIISRIGTWEVEPLPDTDALAMASKLGTQFSAFISAGDLLCSMVRQASDENRAALFCYGVACSTRKSRLANMFEDPWVSLFIEFSDVVSADPSLKKSLADRPPEEYKAPRKGTKIYKAAVDHLKLGGAI